MFEQAMAKPRELQEIERAIADLMQDSKHPLHNQRHPYHRDSVLALNDLMRYADHLRSRLLPL